jgi:glutamate synthase (NADPH/NADH) small chain
MADIKPPYTSQEAIIEANRCLFCFDAPCIQACPTGIDIPSFIKKIVNGNVAAAARTILNANVLGASCARVCPTEELCEGACVVLDLEGDPVKIGRLQRYATDHVFERGITVLHSAANKSGKRVAIIGGGPAGLGCAAELALLGHSPVVFEKKPMAGGLNTYGIAYYKMPPQTSLEEIDMISRLGVEFRCETEVGKQIPVAQLEKEFEAIFVGIGLAGSPRLRVPGEDLPEVVDALDFIAQIHTQPLDTIAVGDRVAVIGGGNTAIDAVTQAIRLGARDAALLYRRTQSQMSAYEFEQEIAKVDGARMVFNVAPIEILADDGGHVAGLKMARTSTAGGQLKMLPGTEFVEPFDMIIKAIGEEKQSNLLKKLFPAIELDSRGVVVRDHDTGRTNLPKVFAGGDCANGGREVVNAVAEGKKAARGMHSMLTGQPVAGPVQPSRYGVEGVPVGSGYNRPVRARELERGQQRPGK